VNDETGEASKAGEQARIFDDALSVLRDTLEWCLTPAGWAGIAAILDDLLGGSGVLDLTDPDRRQAVEDVTIRLELAGPLRIEAVDRAAEPVPPDIRERLNVLIDKLSASDGKGGTPGDKR
jgi:hypothetical protein